MPCAASGRNADRARKNSGFRRLLTEEASQTETERVAALNSTNEPRCTAHRNRSSRIIPSERRSAAFVSDNPFPPAAAKRRPRRSPSRRKRAQTNGRCRHSVLLPTARAARPTPPAPRYAKRPALFYKRAGRLSLRTAALCGGASPYRKTLRRISAGIPGRKTAKSLSDLFHRDRAGQRDDGDNHKRGGACVTRRGRGGIPRRRGRCSRYK